MSTVVLTLPPAEARILDALLRDPADGPPGASNRPVSTLALTQSLGLSASDLLAFASSPAVAAALDAIRQTLTAIDTVRFHSFRADALKTLAAVASSAPNPNHRRQAATTLLRATNPAPARRPAQARERAARANGSTPTNPQPSESPAPSTTAPIPAPAPNLIPPPHPQPLRPVSAQSADNTPPHAPPPSPDGAPANWGRGRQRGARHSDTASNVAPPTVPRHPPASEAPHARNQRPTPPVPSLAPRRTPTRAEHLTSHAGAPPRPP